MLSNLIGGFITILIGANMLPIVATTIYGAQGAGNASASNLTGAASTIAGLTTLFYSLGLMSAGVAVAIGGLRQAGVL